MQAVVQSLNSPPRTWPRGGYGFLSRLRERRISLAKRKLGLGNPVRARAVAKALSHSPALKREGRRNHGFTLIELAIVLVVIGFIVGGVLVGQDMIKAAQVRATLTQLEKFNAAVNTFRGKYGGIPGDLNAAAAAQFNFPPYDYPPCAGMPQFRCGGQGRGDGNGILDAFTTSAISNPSGSLSGETAMFWGDLTFANLIDGSFTADQGDSCVNQCNPVTNVDSVLPAAKLGGGNYITVVGSAGTNYFVLSAIASIGSGNSNYVLGPNPGLTVQQAYAMDKKVDDGLPQSGRVMTKYITGLYTYTWVGAAPGAVASPSSTTCYDNGGNTSNPMAYSVQQNNGAGPNCALSFQFQ